LFYFLEADITGSLRAACARAGKSLFFGGKRGPQKKIKVQKYKSKGKSSSFGARGWSLGVGC
jgi:hypothetical protein